MIVVLAVAGYFVLVVPCGALVGRALQRARECAFFGVRSVTVDQLDADDRGALDAGETGWIGHCRCGHRTRVRYSPVAAQSAIAEHILAGDRAAAEASS